MGIKKVEIRPEGNNYDDILYPKTSTDMVVDDLSGKTVKTSLNDIKIDNDLHRLDMKAHGIGDKTMLKTNDKNSIVGAINELFQYANDIKDKWSSVVGTPLSKNDTSTTLMSKTQNIKNSLSNILNKKGVFATGTEDLLNLINKVDNISTKKKLSPPVSIGNDGNFFSINDEYVWVDELKNNTWKQYSKVTGNLVKTFSNTHRVTENGVIKIIATQPRLQVGVYDLSTGALLKYFYPNQIMGNWESIADVTKDLRGLIFIGRYGSVQIIGEQGENFGRVEFPASNGNNIVPIGKQKLVQSNLRGVTNDCTIMDVTNLSMYRYENTVNEVYGVATIVANDIT